MCGYVVVMRCEMYDIHEMSDRLMFDRLQRYSSFRTSNEDTNES
jgi:hypothetical protein